MSRVFKIASQDTPRSLVVYERDTLEDADLEEPGKQVITPEMILAQARDQADQKVREAYTEGMQRGVEAGRQQFEEAVAQAAAALGASAEAMRGAREQFLASLEPQVVELALEIARRILQREARTDRDLVTTTVRKALRHLADREQMLIRVNPADLEGLRAQKVRLIEDFEDVREIIVEADEALSPGGCIVESRLMQVDARIEAQLDTILEVLHQAPEEPTEG